MALSGGAPVTLTTFTDSQPGGTTWASDALLRPQDDDVTPDGQHFLMIRDEDDLANTSSTVVLVVGFAREMRGRTA